MKPIYIILLSALLLISCNNNKNDSVEDIIASNNLEKIKTKLSEVSQAYDALSQDIQNLNQAAKKLDTNKYKALVTVVKIKDTLFNHYIELQGNVNTEENVILNAEYSGAVQNILVKEGQKVRKGQTLAVIDDGGLQAQLAQLESQKSLSKTTYERQQRLWEQNIGSEIKYLEAKTNYELNKNAVTQLKKQLNKTMVIAPFSGTIEEIVSEKGSNITLGTPMMRIVSLENMYIETEVPEKHLPNIKKGAKVNAFFPVLNKEIAAEIHLVSNYINPANRSFRVEIAVPNKDRDIKPNLTAKVRINDYTNKEAVLLPQSILSENSKGEQYVYVATNINKNREAEAHRVSVKTGKTQGDWVQIVNGLKEGDVVIKEGARSVREGQGIKILN